VSFTYADIAAAIQQRQVSASVAANNRATAVAGGIALGTPLAVAGFAYGIQYGVLPFLKKEILFASLLNLEIGASEIGTLASFTALNAGRTTLFNTSAGLSSHAWATTMIVRTISLLQGSRIPSGGLPGTAQAAQQVGSQGGRWFFPPIPIWGDDD